MIRSSRPEVFLRKGALKICNKFTGEYPRQSTISIKLQSRFIVITLWHGCSPVNLLHIFRTRFPKNTPGWLLLNDHGIASPCNNFRSSHSLIFYRRAILKSWQNLQENLVLFHNKVSGLACNFTKNNDIGFFGCFPVNFAKMFRTTF